MLGQLAEAVDARVGAASWVRRAMNHVFPDHWSFMLGEIAMYAFMILVATGIYLTLFFEPSTARVIYDGAYRPLDGLPMSAAYSSVLDISFRVRAGLLIRQAHHWAALIFLAAIVVHACRIFFTGAFRRPREINWLLGITLLLLALANGFAGYSIVDDLLSGIGLRIAYSIGESIPVVGVWLVSLAFGSEFPGDAYLGRLYIAHVLVIPVLIAGVLSVHLAMVWRQKHTQFPGEGRTETNLVGSRLFPTYAARSIALFLALVGIVLLLGGLAQINPVWLWGPYKSAATTTAAQPDWYVGWLEGALRVFPPWEIRAFGYVVPNPFFPGIVMPGIFFSIMFAYPFIERRLTGDRASHELLDRPRDHPVRTGLGVSVLSYFIVIFLAGSQDILGAATGISVQALVTGFRIALFIVPISCWIVAYYWCRALSTVPIDEGTDVVIPPADPFEAAEPGRRAGVGDTGASRSVGGSASAQLEVLRPERSKPERSKWRFLRWILGALITAWAIATRRKR